MNNYKVAVRHYVNTYLKPRYSDIQGDNSLYYPLYAIIVYMCKNTQIRSLTGAWFTREGFEKFKETGMLDDSDVLAANKENIVSRLNREAKHLIEIVEAWKKAIGMDVPISYSNTDFPRLISVASLSARQFASSIIWEYLSNRNDELRERIRCINTHMTRRELQLRSVTISISGIPVADDLWNFVYENVPKDVDVFEWYLDGYERVKNKNPLFDELLVASIRKTLTTFDNDIY